MPPGYKGSFSKYEDGFGDISLNKELINEKDGTYNGKDIPVLAKTLLHETQHAIQAIEDFARGGNPGMFNEQVKREFNNALNEYREIEKGEGGELLKRWDELESNWERWKDRPGFAEERKDVVQKLEAEHAEAFEKFKAARARLSEHYGGDKQFQLYERLAGEIEARDTADRAIYSDNARRNFRPRLRDDAIVLFGDTPVASYSMDADQSSDRLVAIHNLSTENLMAAHALGGLPVPSIGVTKAATPFSGFGEISLIGTRDMVDPADTPVFSFDAYSVRFPKVLWPKVPTKKAQALIDAMRPHFKKVRDSYDTIWDEMVNRPDRDKAIHDFIRSDGAKVMYLEEQGKTFEPVMKEAQESRTGTMSPELQTLAGLDISFSFGGETHKRISDTVIAYFKDILGRSDEQIKRRLEMDESGLMSFRGAANVLDAVHRDKNRIGKQELDSMSTRDKLSALVSNKDEAFIKWAKEKISSLYGEPSIKVGRKKEPLTLRNIVEAMTSSHIRGKEDAMTFGPGMVKAVTSKRFKTMQELQNYRDQVVSPEQEQAWQKDIDATLGAFREAVLPSYTITNYRGEIDTWEGLDDSMRALALAIKNGTNEKSVLNALARFHFKKPSAEALRLGVKSIKAIREGMTDYFEAKPQRAVMLSEFAGAVVPETINEDALRVLRNAGLEIRTYGKIDGEGGQAQTAFWTSDLPAGADSASLPPDTVPGRKRRVGSRENLCSTPLSRP
jgi:hypothetical protein